MSTPKQPFPFLKVVLTFALVGLTSMSGEMARAQGSLAADLVGFLRRQPDRGCVSQEAKRSAALSLVRLGEAALPDIEGAVDSIEHPRGSWSYQWGDDWLMLADCRAEGRAVFPRLTRLIGRARYRDLRLALDECAALSLGLTSYLSSWNDPLVYQPNFPVCGRRIEPRDPLDRLILSWEQKNTHEVFWENYNREMFESILGPNAKSALISLQRGRTWQGLRSAFWHGKSGKVTSIGYRFDVAGRWAEPVDTLEENRKYDAAWPNEEPGHISIDTLFTTRSGGECGRYRVAFVREEPSLGRTVGVVPKFYEYVVDNADLEGLLKLISFCAVGRAK